jgi:hypothetical protein
MLQTKTHWGLVGMIMLAVTGMALAQAPGGGGPGGGPGGGRNFDPAQFRQMMMDRFKEQLGATDDEWKVLQPKIEAVQAAQRDARGGGFGGFGGGPGGGRNADQAQSPVQVAAQDLRQALDNKDTSADAIQKKLDAYREARAAANKKLQDTQKALMDLLTQRQEAVLVMMGMLD